jgi:hypothetical protein
LTEKRNRPVSTTPVLARKLRLEISVGNTESFSYICIACSHALVALNKNSETASPKTGMLPSSDVVKNARTK